MERLAIIGVALGLVAMVFAIVLSVQHDREAIRAFCQPLGYVGGYMDRYSGSGCIAADGAHVSIQSLKGR